MVNKFAISATTGLMLALTIVPAAQSPRRPTAPLGVLVGLHDVGGESVPSANGDSEPPSVGRLRTLWMRGGESLELTNLLLPRRSGFWRVGLLGECAEEKEDIGDTVRIGTTIADHLWATPVGKQPQVRLSRDDDHMGFHAAPCIERDVYCVNDWTTSVYWIWPDYASLDMGGRGECGVHPDWDAGYTIRSFDDLDKPLRVGDVLGKPAEDSFRKKFETEHKNALPCPAEPAVFEPDSWYIEREAGAWKTTGWSSTHRLCGYGFDYIVDANLSAVTGRRDDSSRWRLLTSKVPQLKDVHASPGDQWTLVVTETELMIFEGAQFDRPLLTAPKASHENVVMVEWAVGSNVARWDAQVVSLRATTEPSARIVRVAR